MAEVILKNIKKVYPHQGTKKKKKGEAEKKLNLQIAEEGILAVDGFDPEIENTAAFGVGSSIAFTFNGAAAHLFDRKSGVNLEYEKQIVV